VTVALRTPRLLLREWRDEDVDPFLAHLANTEVTAMLPPLPDRDACVAWIGRMRAHNETHGFAYWAVELPGEAPLIGAIGLTRVNFADAFGEAVEVGWRLALPYWGKGYATEAARAAIEDGFCRFGIDEIVAFTVPMNQRSQAVMIRLGMARDPTDDFDFYRFPKGHPLRRHVLYRLKKSSTAPPTDSSN
jgi:RimJ/RimL family protein N-acetyltransferase